MRFLGDFHLHSKHSRATSKDMNLEGLAKWAEIKGVKVVGTGDFTHPEWFEGFKDNLIPAEPGLFKLKNSFFQTRFMLTSEVSCVYSQGNKVRKIHIVVLAPSLEAAEKINAHLGRVGNLKADGRPILRMTARELAKIVLGASEDCLIIPAHVMTPWFGIFGSKSGFDSIEECFGEYSKYIFAIESGLSADPAMLWRIPAGQATAIVSNSDSHSPSRIGREANLFDADIDYFAIAKAVKEKDKEKFLATIEFFPQEGKYYYDGHRNCNVRLSPEESKNRNGICPVCGKPLTVGVMSRIEELASKPEGFRLEKAIPFKRLVPLEEIIAEALGVTTSSKQVAKKYEDLIKEFGNEFKVLSEVSGADLDAAVSPEIAEGIIRVRGGNLEIQPGYDGVYGKANIFSGKIRDNFSKQKNLF